MSAPGSESARCAAEGHCITCSDEGVPMRVVEGGAGTGIALCRDEEGRESEVMVGLVGEVAPGDALLVHAGTALLRLDPSAVLDTPEGGPA